MNTWLEYARMTPEELARQDVAAYNLACACGLPDAGLDESACHACLSFLDDRAEETAVSIEALTDFYHDNAAHYESWNRFRMIRLACVMHETHVRYNPARIPPGNIYNTAGIPYDTNDQFIHGAILGDGGTCASLPIIILAVGRRLGFPLKLVAAQGKTAGHLFVRWEDDTDRFNMEVTQMGKGLCILPDEHFREGIFNVPKWLFRDTRSGQSMTAPEELATFLRLRGYRLGHFGHYREALDCLAWAAALVPGHVQHRRVLQEWVGRWMGELQALSLAGYRPRNVAIESRRYPESLDLAWEQAILNLERVENNLFYRRPCHV